VTHLGRSSCLWVDFEASSLQRAYSHSRDFYSIIHLLVIIVIILFATSTPSSIKQKHAGKTSADTQWAGTWRVHCSVVGRKVEWLDLWYYLWKSHFSPGWEKAFFFFKRSLAYISCKSPFVMGIGMRFLWLGARYYF
jgi:hypothetical protein